MLLYVALAVAAMALSCVAAQDEEFCPLVGLFTCAHLVDVTKEDIGYEENEEALDKKCGETKPFMKCLVHSAKKCPGHSENHFYQYFKDQYDTLLRICDQNDDLRKKYLNNAKCLSKHKKEVDKKCGELFDFDMIDDLDKNLCAKLKGNFKCTFDEADKKCGKEASDVLKEMMESTTTFLDKNCNKLKLSDLRILRSMPHRLY
ncbi:uncharacterized protein LOC118183712 [Stegodyphus dumicola]|uniref:uncharacterized protein LOC118183712 n=1 Tax=Stegodyphus dumicola TaxID=202533 RepID=UPI0015B0E201|nr:uncharacterized protein LOC118183712 [Stegodyphus dumicola]